MPPARLRGHRPVSRAPLQGVLPIACRVARTAGQTRTQGVDVLVHVLYQHGGAGLDRPGELPGSTISGHERRQAEPSLQALADAPERSPEQDPMQSRARLSRRREPAAAAHRSGAMAVLPDQVLLTCQPSLGPVGRVTTVPARERLEWADPQPPSLRVAPRPSRSR